MQTFIVSWTERHTATIEVEAESAEEALRLAKSAEYVGDNIELEFTDTVDGTYEVHDENGHALLTAFD